MDKRCELMTDWGNGMISPEASAESAAEAMLYKEIVMLDYEDLEFFYQK